MGPSSVSLPKSHPKLTSPFPALSKLPLTQGAQFSQCLYNYYKAGKTVKQQNSQQIKLNSVLGTGEERI